VTPTRSILTSLLDATGASRVTLRENLPGSEFFPVTEEVLRPGVASLREERTVDLRTQPVVRQIQQGRQVVQNDCRAAFADPGFQRMLETYGDLAAQIVTPIFVAGNLRAIVSVHQLGDPRVWSEREIALATRAADEVRREL
jgi:GAF domain-containing protein